MRRPAAGLLLLVPVAYALSACRTRHRDPEPVPEPYRTVEAPAGRFDPSRWRTAFADNCAPCHGDDGRGHGPGSIGLSPRPANFADPGFLGDRSDGYLFWRISEGKPGTAMPSFKDSLSREERLALVRYLRATWQE